MNDGRALHVECTEVENSVAFSVSLKLHISLRYSERVMRSGKRSVQVSRALSNTQPQRQTSWSPTLGNNH